MRRITMMRHVLTLAASTLIAFAATPARAADEAQGPQVTEVVIDAPVAEVWKAFTTSEGWKLLGVAQADVDFRVGGKIRTHYEADGVLGDEGSIENTILAFEPERMLAFRATKAPKGFPYPLEALEKTW